MKRSLRVALSWAIAVLVLAGVAWLIAASEGQRTVLVVNPLDEPVTVRFGDREVAVAAGGRGSVLVSTGGLDVTVTGKDRRVLDRHFLHVPASGGGQAIYAVLGAAALYRVNVTYADASYASREAPPDERFTALPAERFQVVQADYVLERPPEHMSMPKGSSRVVKTWVDVIDGGWKTALHAAGEFGALPTRYAMALRLHRAYPEDPYPLGIAVQDASVLHGPDAAAALAEESLSSTPTSRYAHWAYARAMRVAGRDAELRARYVALLEREPRDAFAAAMRISVADRDEAEAVARAAVAAFPDDAEVLDAAAYVLFLRGRTAEAIDLYARVPASDEKDVDGHARALVRAGRPREALAVALAGAREKGADASAVGLYVRLARLFPGAGREADPDQVVRDWAGDAESSAAFVKAYLGDSAPGEYGTVQLRPAQRTLLDIVAWAPRNPANALEACRQAHDPTLMQLPEDVALLLALEAWRAGDRGLYRRLAIRVPMSEAAVAAWIDAGVEPPRAWRLDDGHRAALALARERRLRASGLPVPPALRAAARSDPLLGVAYRAAMDWPVPERAPARLQLVLQR